MNKEDTEMSLVEEPQIKQSDEIKNEIPEKLDEEIVKSEEVPIELQLEKNLEEKRLSEKKLSLKYLDQCIFASQLYIFDKQFQTSEDQYLYDSICQFQLLDLIKEDQLPNLFKWIENIKKFPQNERTQWSESQIVIKDQLNDQQFLESYKKRKETFDHIISSLRAESAEEAEKRIEKQKWDNYVPPAEKRPLDEFYDLKEIEKNCVVGPIDISPKKNGGVMKYIMKESTSKFPRTIECNDNVLYMRETRFDNGQLCDFAEKRKQIQKFEMGDKNFQEHLRIVFSTMRKGEIAWIKYSPEYHLNIYHNGCLKIDNIHKDQIIGESIFIKIFVDSVKRQPPYLNSADFQGRLDYFNTIREICKELVAEENYPNAIALYQRCLGEFKNMPKKIRDQMNDDEKKIQLQTQMTLNLNLSICHCNKKPSAPLDGVKCAKEAINLDANSCKAHYRLAHSYKLLNDFENAKASMKEAVLLEPNNLQIRKEYEQLSNIKSKKEKEWYSAMSGFLTSDKLKKLESKEEKQNKLREKIKRKHFGDFNDVEARQEDNSDDDESNQSSDGLINSDEIQSDSEIRPAVIRQRRAHQNQDVEEEDQKMTD